jgi:hypothetical protein
MIGLGGAEFRLPLLIGLSSGSPAAGTAASRSSMDTGPPTQMDFCNRAQPSYGCNNQPATLDDMARGRSSLGMAHTGSGLNSAATFNQVYTDIKAARPVAARIGWTSRWRPHGPRLRLRHVEHHHRRHRPMAGHRHVHVVEIQRLRQQRLVQVDTLPHRHLAPRQATCATPPTQGGGWHLAAVREGDSDVSYAGKATVGTLVFTEPQIRGW